MKLKQTNSLVLILALIVGFMGGMISPYVYSLVMPQAGGFDGNATVMKTREVVREESAVVDVVQRTNEAVVSIVIKKNISIQPQIPMDGFFGIPFFDLRPAPGADQNQTQPGLQRVGGGSGFIIKEDGLIVTNRHVVLDTDAVYTVVLHDGTEYGAEVIARDPVVDLALIKIDKDNLPTLELGDSDALEIGQSVVAIGYALAEFGNTVTKGVISGIGRRVVAGDGFGMSEVLEEAIQTDAAINPGNSGGPLLDLEGKVIGINTAVSNEGQLVGFAIPINSAKRTISSVQETGRIVRPWIGVRYIPVTPRLAETNSLSVTYGALVQRGQTVEDLAVIPGSPADRAGLKENDIILEINGKKLDDRDSLTKEVSKHAVGETIRLIILRQGEEREMTMKLGEYPQNMR